jgi:hypothetical protein
MGHVCLNSTDQQTDDDAQAVIFGLVTRLERMPID